jgi:hypothetical protein
MGPIMIRIPIKTVCNENGFVMGTSILVCALLILAGVFALWTANTEVQLVRNESELTKEFYNAEDGVIDALENYNSGPSAWLTDDFLIAGPEEANNIIIYNDENGHPIAKVEVRCIENTGATIEELSAAANNLPSQAYIGPPPIGSGFSLKYFEIRRYGITATSVNGNTQVQVGAWKVFNKF